MRSSNWAHATALLLRFVTLSTPCPNSMHFASQISDPDQIIFRLHLRFPSLYSKPPWSLSSQIAGQITKPPNGPIHFLDTFAAQSLLRNNSRTMTQWLPQIKVIILYFIISLILIILRKKDWKVILFWINDKKCHVFSRICLLPPKLKPQVFVKQLPQYL